jgi:hypothetical protein
LILEIKELGYQLVPHREGLCYELYKWKPRREVTRGRYAGTVAPAAWISTGHYPTNIAHGLATILDLAVNADPEIIRDVRQAEVKIRAAKEAILAATWSDTPRVAESKRDRDDAGTPERGMPLSAMLVA